MMQLRLAALVAVLYLATGFLSRAVAESVTQTTPVWLAAGVLFSALLVCARWSWPAVLGGGASLIVGAIESVSMAIGAWIATLGRQDPRRPAGAGLLIAGALIGSVL